jgi:DNA-binding transcriptional LysR family regulator
VPFSPLASITLHQLRVFLVTARAPSLREAAEELGVTVPTLSEQVRILERVVARNC